MSAPSDHLWFTALLEKLLEGDDAGPLAEQRADVLERVEVGDRVVPVGVLAQLLDAAVEVAEDRVEVDDVLAVELQDDSQDAVGRGVLGTHVDEHLAVAEGVELGLALGPGRVRRDGLEDADLLVEEDPRVVGRGMGPGTGAGVGGRHRSVSRCSIRPASGGSWRPAWRCGGRGSAPCAARRHPASGPRRRAGRSPSGAGSSGSRAACRSGAGRGCPRT